MKFYVSVAWRNLWRHARRSLITATAMAVAVALCMAMIAFTDGMFAQMFDVMVRQQLGHAQVHHPDYPGRRAMHDTVEDAAAVVAELRALPSTELVSPRLNVFGLIGGAEKTSGGQLIGVDPAPFAAATDMTRLLKSGSWLADGPAHEVLLGDLLARELAVGLGDEIVVVTQAADGSLGNDLFTVKGTVHTGNTALDKGGALIHLADAQALVVLPDQVHEIVLLSAEADDLVPYVTEVAALLPDLDVKPWYEASPQTAQMLGMQDVSSYILLGIVFTVAAFGVLNTMMMSVFERTRELGVLKALGIRPWRLVVLVLVESVFLAGVANVIGLALGLGLDAYLVAYGIDFSGALEGGFEFSGITIDPVMKGLVRPHMIAITVAAVFVVAALASLWPAMRAARLQPVESLRAE